jgi:hypothetical protein
VEDDVSPGFIGSAVSSAVPTPTCDKGHKPKVGKIPENIGQVWWTGNDGYLI